MAPVDVHRVVVLGAGQVGKTALINRFITGEYEDNYSPTLEDLHKHIHMLPGGKALHIEILDTSGSHEFPAMRQLGIQSGHGFLIVYALNDTDSFKEAIELVKHVKVEKGEGVPICLCGNKTDLDILDRSFHGEYRLTSVIQLEASAKTNIEVETVFLRIFTELVNNTTIPIRISDEQKESFRDKVKRRLSLLQLDIMPLRRHSDGDGLKEDDVTSMPRSYIQTFSLEPLTSKVTTQRRKSIGNPESFDDTEDSSEFTDSHFSSMPRRHITCPSSIQWETKESKLKERLKKDSKIGNVDTTRVKTCVENVFDSPLTIPITTSEKRRGSLRNKVKRRLSLQQAEKSPLRRHSDGDGLKEDDVTSMPRSYIQTFSLEPLTSKVTTQRRKSIGNPESFDDTEDSSEFTDSQFSSMPRRHSTCPISIQWDTKQSKLKEVLKNGSKIESVNTTRVKENVFKSPVTISDKRKGSLPERVKHRLSLLLGEKLPLRRRSDGDGLKEDNDVTPMPWSPVHTFSSFRSSLKMKGSHARPELLTSKVTVQRRKSIGNPDSLDDAEDSLDFTALNLSAMPRRHSFCPIPIQWETKLKEELKED